MFFALFVRTFVCLVVCCCASDVANAVGCVSRTNGMGGVPEKRSCRTGISIAFVSCALWVRSQKIKRAISCAIGVTTYLLSLLFPYTFGISHPAPAHEKQQWRIHTAHGLFPSRAISALLLTNRELPLSLSLSFLDKTITFLNCLFLHPKYPFVLLAQKLINILLL